MLQEVLDACAGANLKRAVANCLTLVRGHRASFVATAAHPTTYLAYVSEGISCGAL
jgi:hypothetical protein